MKINNYQVWFNINIQINSTSKYQQYLYYTQLFIYEKDCSHFTLIRNQNMQN